MAPCNEGLCYFCLLTSFCDQNRQREQFCDFSLFKISTYLNCIHELVKIVFIFKWECRMCQQGHIFIQGRGTCETSGRSEIIGIKDSCSTVDIFNHIHQLSTTFNRFFHPLYIYSVEAKYFCAVAVNCRPSYLNSLLRLMRLRQSCPDEPLKHSNIGKIPQN